MRIVKIFIVYFILLTSCIYPFEPDVEPDDSKILVVEGQITDQEGSFRVKLTYSSMVNNMEPAFNPVYSADVIISDNEGGTFPLIYDVNGWYASADTLLKGIPGNYYKLQITTIDGDQYESSEVLMKEVPKIDSLYYGEVKKSVILEEELTEEKWLNIYVNADDPNGQTKYWKWEFEETWEVKTPKDSVLAYIVDEDGTITGVDGVYYFRVNVDFNKGNPREGWDNNKVRCWVEMPSSSIIIESTEEKVNDRIEKFPVLSIPPKTGRLFIKYSILVKQSALSKELYDYFTQLAELNEQSGSMFDKMPEQLLGNIYCCNRNKVVLGYFSASSVKTKRIIIQPFDHDIEIKDPYDDCVFHFKKIYTLGIITEIADPKFKMFIGSEIGDYNNPWCTDCRYAGTNVMPDYWEEEE